MDECKRCGTCCMKGGPALHLDDKELVEQGCIPLGCLYTIRKGEIALDNVMGRLFEVSKDIVRIKSAEGSGACVLFDGEKNECSIYRDRPLECRALKCWDTQDIKEAYAEDRLSRKVILEKSPDFSELVDYHESKCDYRKIRELIAVLDDGKNEDAIEQLREILALDDHLRGLVLEKTSFDEAILDFLFGRSLKQVLPGMGLKVVKKEGKYVLSKKKVRLG